jgi:hypothetical protein
VQRRRGSFYFLIFFFLFGVLGVGAFVGIPVLVIVLVVFVLRQDDEMHRVRLRHFEFRIALRAAENFAFLDFVFVQIDFSVAFRASGQGYLSCAGFGPSAYYITPVSRNLREESSIDDA